MFTRFVLAMEFVAIAVLRFEAHRSLGVAVWKLLQQRSSEVGTETDAALEKADVAFAVGSIELDAAIADACIERHLTREPDVEAYVAVPARTRGDRVEAIAQQVRACADAKLRLNA